MGNYYRFVTTRNKKWMAEARDNYRDEIFSLPIRAGKRTYFFDVKATRANDLYLTVTESKKKYNDGGEFYFEKHKIFLYKEDFEKFSEGLNEAIAKINELKESGEYEVKDGEGYERRNYDTQNGYSSDVNFDNLD